MTVSKIYSLLGTTFLALTLLAGCHDTTVESVERSQIAKTASDDVIHCPFLRSNNHLVTMERIIDRLRTKIIEYDHTAGLNLTKEEWSQIDLCFEDFKSCVYTALNQTDPPNVTKLCECYQKLIECLKGVRNGVLTPVLP